MFRYGLWGGAGLRIGTQIGTIVLNLSPTYGVRGLTNQLIHVNMEELEELAYEENQPTHYTAKTCIRIQFCKESKNCFSPFCLFWFHFIQYQRQRQQILLWELEGLFLLVLKMLSKFTEIKKLKIYVSCCFFCYWLRYVILCTGYFGTLVPPCPDKLRTYMIKRITQGEN